MRPSKSILDFVINETIEGMKTVAEDIGLKGDI